MATEVQINEPENQRKGNFLGFWIEVLGERIGCWSSERSRYRIWQSDMENDRWFESVWSQSKRCLILKPSFTIQIGALCWYLHLGLRNVFFFFWGLRNVFFIVPTKRNVYVSSLFGPTTNGSVWKKKMKERANVWGSFRAVKWWQIFTPVFAFLDLIAVNKFANCIHDSYITLH